MPFFTGRGSGFKNPKDFALFGLGFGLVLYHMVTVNPSNYNMPFLLFGGGLMGAQYVISKDNKGDKE